MSISNQDSYNETKNNKVFNLFIPHTFMRENSIGLSQFP